MPISDQFIFTPFFLDQPAPGLTPYVPTDAVYNRPELPRDTNEIGRVSVIADALAGHTAHAVQSGMRPISFAGDCMSSIGVMAGLNRAGIQPVLIWFDAHGDFNTWETTPSGFIGGMPLAMLVGRGDGTILRTAGLQPMNESQVILTDARDLDPGERDAVAESGVVHLKDVRDLMTYPLPENDLYVHFDVDVLDAAIAPAHRYPVPGGASEETMRAVFARLANTGRVRAVSVSAWYTDADEDGRTGELSMSLLQTLIG